MSFSWACSCRIGCTGAQETGTSTAAALTLYHMARRTADKGMPQFAGCCAHDHDCEAAECGPAWSLHSHIDTAHVRQVAVTART